MADGPRSPDSWVGKLKNIIGAGILVGAGAGAADKAINREADTSASPTPVSTPDTRKPMPPIKVNTELAPSDPVQEAHDAAILASQSTPNSTVEDSVSAIKRTDPNYKPNDNTAVLGVSPEITPNIPAKKAASPPGAVTPATRP